MEATVKRNITNDDLPVLEVDKIPIIPGEKVVDGHVNIDALTVGADAQSLKIESIESKKYFNHTFNFVSPPVTGPSSVDKVFFDFPNAQTVDVAIVQGYATNSPSNIQKACTMHASVSNTGQVTVRVTTHTSGNPISSVTMTFTLTIIRYTAP